MKKILISLIIAATSFLTLWIGSFSSANTDLLEKAFQPSKTQQQIVNLGNNKNAVGNEVFVWWVELDIGRGNGNDSLVNTSAKLPLVVRIIRALLRLTLVISVTMVIFNGILYILAAGNEWQTQKARTNIIYVGAGILVALFSLTFILLIQSFTQSSVSFDTVEQFVEW